MFDKHDHKNVHISSLGRHIQLSHLQQNQTVNASVRLKVQNKRKISWYSFPIPISGETGSLQWSYGHPVLISGGQRSPKLERGLLYIYLGGFSTVDFICFLISCVNTINGVLWQSVPHLNMYYKRNTLSCLL